MKPMSRAELLALPPVIDLPTLGRALGISEPTVRERARCNELDALGIRVVRLGAQHRVITASLWAFLGLNGPADGGSSEEPPRIAAGQRRPSASALRSVGDEGC